MNIKLKTTLASLCVLFVLNLAPSSLFGADTDITFPLFTQSYSPKRSTDSYTFRLENPATSDACRQSVELDNAEYIGCGDGHTKLILLKNKQEIASYLFDLPSVPGDRTSVMTYDNSKIAFTFRVKFIKSVTCLAPDYYVIEIDRHIR